MSAPWDPAGWLCAGFWVLSLWFSIWVAHRHGYAQGNDYGFLIGAGRHACVSCGQRASTCGGLCAECDLKFADRTIRDAESEAAWREYWERSGRLLDEDGDR